MTFDDSTKPEAELDPIILGSITRLFEEVLLSTRRSEGKTNEQTDPTSNIARCDSSAPALLLAGPSTVMESVITRLLDRALFHGQSINQFAMPTDSDIARIREAIVHWLEELGKALQREGAEFARAGILLLDAIESAFRLHPDEAAQKIVSEQYSVETQFDVLDVDPSTLLDPVLDLGCGQDAAFVKWLRQRKLNAIGVDRFVDSVPGCVRGDWLGLPFPSGQFGTVLAHLSFSLHFLYHHLRPDGDARAYAKAYMAILGSLRSSGRFIYAPGLPFIERLLPTDRYKVAKHPILRVPFDVQGAAIFEQALGESPLYATHITRIR